MAVIDGVEISTGASIVCARDYACTVAPVVSGVGRVTEILNHGDNVAGRGNDLRKV